MRVLKTVLTITAKGGLSVLFAVVLVLGVLALDKSFNLVSKLTGSPQVSAVSSPALSNKFCDDPASESQTGCTSFIPSVLAAASTPYQDVSGNVNISGNVKFGAGAYLYSSVNDNFTLHTQTNTPNPNLTIGYGQGIEPGNIDGTKEYFTMNAGRFMFQNGRVGIRTDNPVAPLTVNAINNQAIRVENGGSSGRITFVATNNSNLWNIDNMEGRLRFFRENYSSSGYGSNGSVKMVIGDNGRIGIGTDYPNATFETVGEARFSSPERSSIILSTETTPAGNNYSHFGILGRSDGGWGHLISKIWNWGGSFRWIFGSGGGDVEVMKVDHAGSLWIRGALTQGSSKEYKKEISDLSEKDLQKILEKLNNTTLVSYKYKSEGADIKPHIGVIAEEAPEEITSDDKKGIITTDYMAFLLASIKAQQKEIETLKKEIEELKSK